MAIIYQGIILLFVFSLASAQTSPPNPECRGMNTAARHLQTGIKSIPGFQKSAKCNPNKQCSGVTCKWSSSGLLEVDLQYCRHPVKYHVLFKDSDLNVDRNFTIGENHKETLYSNPLGTVSIQVTELRRSRNIVTTSVDLLTCPIITPHKCGHIHVLPQQMFCVRMDKCQGFNASVDHYKPCSYTLPPTTFISSSRRPVPRTDPLLSSRSSSSGRRPVPRTDPLLSSRSSSSGPHPHYPGNGPSSDPLAQGYSREDKDKSSKDLSTGAIIGICAAGLFVILIVIGAAVYWKKYHRRTRLRAAYYNDISMHDPLCGEDFGPEVA
ncbi:uncharacterized protein LOC122957053 isoform X1 [Acropora millepora]|uniref:uncharacterized protein LOC122957053 isoform X1 n=1 Tax=Acropora millepora TaxID=45264 RepID=UPI001CF0F1C6|nr:uncharacterized protein LOC122957053 isoform X1 [Acropora millepora]